MNWVLEILAGERVMKLPNALKPKVAVNIRCSYQGLGSCIKAPSFSRI